MRADYPRLFYPEFLSRCGPRVRAMYQYWERKRNNRLAPCRADIEPFDIKDCLPGIAIVDVRRFPDELVYRLVGTRGVEARGSDPTGRTVLTSFIGIDGDEILENYRLVIEEARIVYDFDRTPTPSGLFIQSEVILLPLSSDNRHIDKVLVYFESSPRDHTVTPAV